MEWFTKLPGNPALVNPSMVAILGANERPRVLRLPPALGDNVVTVTRQFAAPCPCKVCDTNVTHLSTEVGVSVAECVRQGTFLWYASSTSTR